VLNKFQFSITEEEMNAIVNAKPMSIEKFLLRLKRKIDQYLSSPPKPKSEAPKSKKGVKQGYYGNYPQEQLETFGGAYMNYGADDGSFG
jgi:hypothetical protein